MKLLSMPASGMDNSKDLLTKVKKKIQKFKQHKNGAPKQATLHLKFQMVAVRR